MENNYKISIIIPVYNAEKTLENTIQSIINQTIGFENIELILVNDNSKDNSIEIIKKYSNSHHNIKTINLKENSGTASKPRNIGIQKSTAPYIMFLDSDDAILSDFCEVLYNKITSFDVDIANCSTINKLNNKLYMPKSIQEINTKHIMENNNNISKFGFVIWNNIYKKSFILENNIEFKEIKIIEDAVFLIECLLLTKKPILKMENYPGYIYLIENSNSLTHKVSNKTLLDFIEGYKSIDKLLENYPNDEEKFRIRSILTHPVYILMKMENLKEGIQILYNFEKELDYDLTFNSKYINIINNKIKNKKHKQAYIILKILSTFYKNKKIRNMIFTKFQGLKEIDKNEIDY